MCLNDQAESCVSSSLEKLSATVTIARTHTHLSRLGPSGPGAAHYANADSVMLRSLRAAAMAPSTRPTLVGGRRNMAACDEQVWGGGRARMHAARQRGE
eukprot:SAG22_NODE_1666_length_3859_cov_292.311702_2_plen_99_part_00